MYQLPDEYKGVLIKEFDMMNKMMKEFKNNKKFARKMKGLFGQ